MPTNITARMRLRSYCETFVKTLTRWNAISERLRAVTERLVTASWINIREWSIYMRNIYSSYLLGLLAMIKCSICSYQCDNWYGFDWIPYLSHQFFLGAWFNEACLMIIAFVPAALHFCSGGHPHYRPAQDCRMQNKWKVMRLFTCHPYINLPGWRWAMITKVALDRLSRSLHSGVCDSDGYCNAVVHSTISGSGGRRARASSNASSSSCFMHCREKTGRLHLKWYRWFFHSL